MRWLCGVALLGASLAQATSGDASSKSLIQAVGAENEYANVVAQVGGRYVSVTSIMSNPNTDPHTFEVSTSVAQGHQCPGSAGTAHEHEESAPLVQTSHDDPRRPVR
jgi:hypothetical protein